MNRLTGRSVYILPGQEKYLRLAQTDEKLLPENLLSIRQKAIQEFAVPLHANEYKQEPIRLCGLILKLTNACNFACTYCYDHNKACDKAVHMDIKVAMNAIEQALSLCSKGLRIIFHGGEPFHVFELIKKIVPDAEKMAASRDKLIFFTGQTNFSLFNDDILNFSKKHHIKWGISLDGPATVNNTFRIHKDGGGTHKRFEKCMQRYPGLIRQSTVLATITSANQSKLSEISRYFRACGFKAWDWSLFYSFRPTEDTRRISIKISDLLHSWNELFDDVIKGEFDGFSVLPVLNYVNNFLDGPVHHACLRRFCAAGRELLSVSVDGQIKACDCIDPKSSIANMGNINQITLQEALDCHTARRIRSRDSQRSKCKKCIWLGVCGGTCLAHVKSLHEVNEIECQIALNAFNRISKELASSTRLTEYRKTCCT